MLSPINILAGPEITVSADTLRTARGVRVFPILPRGSAIYLPEQILEIIAVVEAAFQGDIRDGVVGGQQSSLGVF